MNPVYWPIDEQSFVRSLVPDDAEALFELVEANRARLSQWMPWAESTTSPSDTREFIERSRASETDIEANGIWVGEDLVGVIGISVEPLSGVAMIGYWIDEAFEGRGLITRACALFIDHAFGELGMHRMELHAGVDNARSRAVAERLGFTQEGVLREAERVGAGRYVDLAVYGLLEHEWRRA